MNSSVVSLENRRSLCLPTEQEREVPLSLYIKQIREMWKQVLFNQGKELTEHTWRQGSTREHSEEDYWQPPKQSQDHHHEKTKYVQEDGILC